MPIREYKCPSCQHTTEILMKMSDEVPETSRCEGCGSTANLKRFSQNSFKLMGEGWWKPSLTNRNYKPLGGLPHAD